MKNVVKKFVGRNEKELNPELVQMAAYYGYAINVTNCFSGNEKGSVENSVKVLRNKIFAGSYTFASLDEAREYMRSQLLKLSEKSRIDEEKQHIQPYRPPLELAVLTENTVNPYSMVVVDTAHYSVPEHFVGKKVMVKKYHDEIRVYANNVSGSEEICRHKRIFGKGNMSVNIHHYLNNLLRKPGAVRNSAALKSIPKLKAIFDMHYSKEPKRFIEIFLGNQDKSINEIIALFEEKTNGTAESRAEMRALSVIKPPDTVNPTNVINPAAFKKIMTTSTASVMLSASVEVRMRTAVVNYGQLINMGVQRHGGDNTWVGGETVTDIYPGQCGGSDSGGSSNETGLRDVSAWAADAGI